MFWPIVYWSIDSFFLSFFFIFSTNFQQGMPFEKPLPNSKRRKAVARVAKVRSQQVRRERKPPDPRRRSKNLNSLERSSLAMSRHLLICLIRKITRKSWDLRLLYRIITVLLPYPRPFSGQGWETLWPTLTFLGYLDQQPRRIDQLWKHFHFSLRIKLGAPVESD